jgi:folylpolyglutamate synthase/dihydropteroate synthase
VAVLTALMADKRVDDVLAALLPGAASVTATQVDSPRALPAPALAEACRKHVRAPVAAVADPHAALEAARAATRGGGLLLVAGSLYLAGLLRPRLTAPRGSPGS